MSFGGPLSASPLSTPNVGDSDVPPLDAAYSPHTSSPLASVPAGAPPATPATPASPSAPAINTPDNGYLAPPSAPSAQFSPQSPTFSPQQHPVRSSTQPLAAVRENSGPIQLPLRRRTHPASRNTDDMPAVQRVMSDLLTPEHKVGPAPTFWQSIKAFFLSSWM